MSTEVSVSRRTEVELSQRHDDIDLIDDDVTKEWDVSHGNTMKIASLFGDVVVGAKRQSIAQYRESKSKVVRVSHSKQRRDSSSDSSDEDGKKRQVIKSASVTVISKADHQSDSSSSDEGTKSKVTKVTKVTTSTKASRQGRDSSSDEDQKGKVTKVTKVTTSTKASRHGSDEDQKGKVTKVTKVTVAKVERRRDRSSSDSEDEEKTERKTVTVVKQKSAEAMHETGKERRHEKASKKGDRRDSSEERQLAVVKKEVRQDKKGTKEVTLAKKTVTREDRSDSSSSDDEREETKVRRTNVSAAVMAFNKMEDDHREERIREGQKEKAKLVERKARDSSSDSDEEGRRRQVAVSKEVKLTRRAEVDRSSSDSESEDETKRVKKVQKQEEHKRVVKARDDSDSDADAGKRVKASKVEKVRKEVVEKKETKAKETRERSRSSSSSSSDEETTQKRETKVVKVTKSSDSSSSSSDDEDEERTKPKKVNAKKRKVLVVSAHASKDSYEGALYKAALKLFKGRGDKVQTSNLYEMGFNPVASPRDFGGYTKDKGFYNYSLLAGQARAEGRLAQDIVAEQEKVLWADFVLVVSPIQNHGLPAILKGWFDRVMIYNFAYSEGHFYEKGLLRDKKVLLCLTSAGLSSMYTPSGIHGDLNVYLWPIVNGILRFAGFDVLRPQIYFGVGRASAEQKDKAAEALLTRLHGVWNEKPIAFIPTERFRQKRGFALSGRSLNELADEGKLTVAQYTGSQMAVMTVTFEPDVKSGVDVGNPWHV